MSSVCVLARPNRLCMRRIRRSPLRRLKKPMSFITLSMWATMPFDLLVGRGVVFLLQMGHGRIGLAEDFVAHNLHGLGEVEREIVGVAVDGHQSVAGLDFFDAQTERFVAEDQRHFLAAVGSLQ